jgi:alkylation response protein AidB-like acyl-CoA dehydrogenase
MDFELDADQRDLQATAQAVITKECSAAFVRAVVDDGADPSPWWHTMVGLYWPALAIEEATGGLGLTWVELATVLEELGRAVDPSPFVATTTQFVPVVRSCGDPEQARRWLGAVAAGTCTGTFAIDGAHQVPAAAHPSVRATTAGGAWQLNGTVSYVVDGNRADEIAVVADTDDGLGVFVVPGTAGGLNATAIASLDPTVPVSHLHLADVVVPDDRRLRGADIAGGLADAIEEATVGCAVTTVGACQRVLDLTLEHVKQRHQFGKPIGSFQAVKHKATDMYVAVERARALAYFAALTIVEDDPRRSVAVSMAKAAAGECQRVVFQHGIQLFGGMGFTWENDLQFALRRAKYGALVFGRTADHRRRVAQEALAR